jgi:hypothetical protein
LVTNGAVLGLGFGMDFAPNQLLGATQGAGGAGGASAAKANWLMSMQHPAASSPTRFLNFFIRFPYILVAK